MTFERINKYLVLKWDDIFKYLTPNQKHELREIIDDIEQGRYDSGKEMAPDFVCIKSSYPEYEYVWKCIEDRVTKKEQEQNDN